MSGAVERLMHRIRLHRAGEALSGHRVSHVDVSVSDLEAVLDASGMSTGTAKTPQAVEGRSPASPVVSEASETPTSSDPSLPETPVG